METVERGGEAKGLEGWQSADLSECGPDASIIRNSSALSRVHGWARRASNRRFLGPLIRDVLASGKTVTFAIKHVAPEEAGMETEV